MREAEPLHEDVCDVRMAPLGIRVSGSSNAARLVGAPLSEFERWSTGGLDGYIRSQCPNIRSRECSGRSCDDGGKNIHSLLKAGIGSMGKVHATVRTAQSSVK